MRAHGIEARLPDRFEAHIFRRVPGAGEATYPVAHFATFPIPPDTGDFGGGAVGAMRATDVFMALFEFGPESLSAPLFARQGMPRTLRAQDFRPEVLRRGIPGHCGTQWFFTEAGRPFTLYAVLGSHALRHTLVPRVNDVLSGITLSATRSPVPEPVPPSWN